MEHPLLSESVHAYGSNTQGRIATSTFEKKSPCPSLLEELAHEVRQPLSVIESLAYYLELTAVDEKTRVHLQRIQAMVLQANLILKRACKDQFQTAVAG